MEAQGQCECMKVQIVDDVNDRSGHDVQDNGEDYNEA